MPKYAYSVTLRIDTTDTVTLSDNAAIQKLFLVDNIDIHLQNIPLHSLIINAGYKSYNRYRSKVSLDVSMMKQLRELVVAGNCSFIEHGYNVYITNLPLDGYLFKVPLPEMVIFRGNLLMTKLKKLTLDYRFLDIQYIPSGLEEYIVILDYTQSNRIDEFKANEKHLFDMPSIRRMPLLLISDQQTNIPFESRYNVYYDIFVYHDGEFIKGSSFEWLTGDLIRAVIHNKRYLDKNKTLESFY